MEADNDDAALVEPALCCCVASVSPLGRMLMVSTFNSQPALRHIMALKLSRKPWRWDASHGCCPLLAGAPAMKRARAELAGNPKVPQTPKLEMLAWMIRLLCLSQACTCNSCVRKST